MTLPSQKNRERFYVEEAAKALGVTWTIDPNHGEQPDFIVNENEVRFGLEVREIFRGSISRRGAAAKEAEVASRRMMTALQRNFEASENIALGVWLVGRWQKDDMHLVVPAIRALKLSSKPIGYREVIELKERLRIYVTRRPFAAHWQNVNDTVGWVDRNPSRQIAAAVKEKASKLAIYRNNAGPDVRLLLVANSIYNSGKMTLADRPRLDRCGFDAVYFFAFPNSITAFDRATDPD